MRNNQWRALRAYSAIKENLTRFAHTIKKDTRYFRQVMGPYEFVSGSWMVDFETIRGNSFLAHRFLSYPWVRRKSDKVHRFYREKGESSGVTVIEVELTYETHKTWPRTKQKK